VVVEAIPVELEQLLTFELGTRPEVRHVDGRVQRLDRSSAGGAQTRLAAQIQLPGRTETFGIFFQPSGFSQLFAVPIYELTDWFGDAAAVLGPVIPALWNRLGESSSFEERVGIAEEFLLYRVACAHAHNAISAAANYLLRVHGAVRVADLAARVSSGLRQFERKFVMEVGSSPKVFARVARFQGALDAKVASPKRRWIDIAHSFGYHDQMHMIHDFEKLGRHTPTQLFAQLGDNRPPAVASVESEKSY
jgi:AraC-like DNA-binding protein